MIRPLRTCIFVMLTWIFTTHCARVSSASGGKKDTIPPVLVIATPTNETLNFHHHKIRFKFNEYVKLNKVYNQLVISPPLKYRPEIIPLGLPSKKITIKIKDTLIPNKTYVFDFGKSVVDNNEGNPLIPFRYVFSTGNTIDSLEVEGTVVYAKSRKEAKNITVALYRADSTYHDSLVYKGRPLYIGNTLDSIAFKMTHLSKGTYHLVAIEDKNNDYKFQSKRESIGFLQSPITIPSDSTTYKLRLFRETPVFKVIRPIEQQKGKIFIGYHGNWGDTKIDFKKKIPKDFKYFMAPMKDKDTLILWHNAATKDSLFVHIKGKSVDSIYRVKLRKSKQDTLRVNAGISGTLHINDRFFLQATHPISKIDTSRIHIFDKDTTLVQFNYKVNPTKDKLFLDFKTSPKNKYYIQALPKSIIDFYGQTNDTIIHELRTMEKDFYAILDLQFSHIPSSEMIFWASLLDNSANIIARKELNSDYTVRFDHVIPGTYYVQLLLDANKNGMWDTGNFKKKIPPEEIINFGKPLKVRSNWELVEKLDVKAPIFIPKKGKEAKLERAFDF